MNIFNKDYQIGKEKKEKEWNTVLNYVIRELGNAKVWPAICQWMVNGKQDARAVSRS